jgi:hypothetical protein
LEGGPPRFKPDFTCPTLLRNILRAYLYLTYGAITRYGGPFQVPSVIKISSISESYNTPHLARLGKSKDSKCQKSKFGSLAFWYFGILPNAVRYGVWAVPRSLATTKGISFDFFSLGTKMFQFSKYPLPSLCIQLRVSRIAGSVYLFGNLRVNACITAHRSLSQFSTSFIGTKCRGIHYMPCL